MREGVEVESDEALAVAVSYDAREEVAEEVPLVVRVSSSARAKESKRSQLVACE